MFDSGRKYTDKYWVRFKVRHYPLLPLFLVQHTYPRAPLRDVSVTFRPARRRTERRDGDHHQVHHEGQRREGEGHQDHHVREPAGDHHGGAGGHTDRRVYNRAI